MFFTHTDARARQFYRIINAKRNRRLPQIRTIIEDAFHKELSGLRAAIRDLSPHSVEHAADTYLASVENKKIWLDVWKQINLIVGSDAWEFLKEGQKSLSFELPALPSLPSLETKAIAALGHYPTDWQNIVFQNVAEKGGRLVKQVEKTTQQQVGGILAQGIADGKSTYQLEKMLDQLYLDEIIPHREEVIARTETARATNDATIEQAKEGNPNSKKRWITVGDDRVRPEHADMEGVEVDLDEDFECADGTTEPGEAINCRCVTGIVPPEEYTPEMFAEEGVPAAEAPAVDEWPDQGFADQDAIEKWAEGRVADGAYFEDADVDVATDFTHAVYNTLNDETRNHIPNKIGWIAEEMPSNPRNVMWTTTHGKARSAEIFINRDLTLRDFEDMTTRGIEARMKPGGHPFASGGYADNPTDYIQRSVDHEFGHIVYADVGGDNSEFGIKWQTTYELLQGGKQPGKELLGRITDYSMYDREEGFAEMYSLYVNGNKEIIPEPFRLLMDGLKLVK